jgi:hypothetical protein
MTLEIERMLVLSTSHLTEATAKLLPCIASSMMATEDTAPWFPTFAREEGWVFYVAGDGECYLEAPEDLMRVIRYASDHECAWLMLDRDGPKIKELPHWEW